MSYQRDPHEDHESRIRSLEKFRYSVQGAVLTLGALLGGLVGDRIIGSLT